ncbi:MAG: helix-turn-helix domain-containing protein [Clostridiales bacterium]|nr:helix-turn-helix domain-containing protein [Clostridiales bacterium]
MEVKLARIKAGLTQTELCKIIKTSPKKLVAIERGHYENVNKSLMVKIAKALNTTVQELFFSEED